MTTKKTRYLFITPSGKTHSVSDSVRYAKRHAQFFADRTGEKVETFVCKLTDETVPTVHYPKGATKAQRATIRKIAAIRCKLTTAINMFNSLPRRESFSGLHYASEIDSLQKQLEAIGDKSTRIYPEITIEV